MLSTAQSAMEGTPRISEGEGLSRFRTGVRSISTSGRWVTVAWKLPVPVPIQSAGRTVA